MHSQPMLQEPSEERHACTSQGRQHMCMVFTPGKHEEANMCPARVRRAQAIRALLRDGPRLAEEREAFRAKRSAYVGYSRADMRTPGAGAGASPATPALRRSVRAYMPESFDFVTVMGP